MEGSRGDDIVKRLISHRLQQGDIDQLLRNVPSSSRDDFRQKIAGILSKVSALLEVSNRVSDTLRLDVLLGRIIDTVTEALNADRGTLFLNDRESGELYSIVLMGDLNKEIRFPNHMGIAGSVFKSGQGVIIADAYKDERFNQKIDKETGYRTRNILCAPITARSRNNEVIGVTQVLNKAEGGFTEDDLELLEAITSQASSALLNAQLFEQVEKARKEEEEMLAVTTAISSEIRLIPLLCRIMETTTKLLDADRSTLFVNDEKSSYLWSQVAEGIGANEIRFPNHLGIAGSVFISGETVNIPDAYDDSRFNPEFDKKTGYKTNSILCMPVINKESEIIGVTQVLNKKGGPFSTTDEKRLQAFSSQVSIALENAKMFDEIEKLMHYNESILESMSNGVLTLDGDLKIVKYNASFLKIFDVKPENVFDINVSEYYYGENEWILEKIEKVILTQESEVFMDVEIRISGRESVSTNLTIVPLISVTEEESTIGSMLLFEDITTEKRIKSTMARYMSKEVADKLLNSEEDMLGGQSHEATVLFSDIRSFTTLTESLGSQDTVSMLNEYFSIMVDVILREGGILDKYIGDAIMAVFGAPFPSDEDADKAVRTGIGMLQDLRKLNDDRVFEEKIPIKIGIGINTDFIVSGNIGSLKRMDYTVIGDGVNLGSRLEGVTKYYGTPLLISEFTKNALKNLYTTRLIDLITVKGKTKPIKVYEVLDHHTTDSFPNMKRVLDLFQEGLDKYRERHFEEACGLFKRALIFNPKDMPSRIYLDRCGFYQENPPPDDWVGVWVMETK